jgi:hypothetical protein
MQKTSAKLLVIVITTAAILAAVTITTSIGAAAAPPPQPQTGNTTNSTADFSTDTFYRNLADCSVLGDPVLEVQCHRVKADQLTEALEEPGIFSFQQEDNKEENNGDKEDEEN